ncbi:MAG TPA: YihY/virulence factor BrkB family protein [Polyangia bacterium]|nr:YihY/virulence factor BrkB family protein [Polyangia bacterium]
MNLSAVKARFPKTADLVGRIYGAYDHHRVADNAAAVSYYFVFALFPFLFFLATLTAYIPYVRDSVGTLLARAHDVMPPQAMALIDKQVGGLVNQPRPRLLTLGLLATLYSASRGVDAVRKALNMAFHVRESRPLWRTELIAFGVTIGGAILVLFGIAVLVAGGSGGLWLARHVGVTTFYIAVYGWLRWPVTVAAIVSCAALAYTFLPNVVHPFKLVTPGALIGTTAWLLTTIVFADYAAHAGSYNVTYGSIGGVIALMTWFYISAFIFLMGGEVNAIWEGHTPSA